MAVSGSVLGFGTAAGALILSIAAILVSAGAVVYARQQAKAQRGVNAPTVKGEVAGAHLNQTSGLCTVTLTFDGKNHIRRAVVSVRSGSGVERIGQPGSATPDRTRIELDEVTFGTPIEFPGEATDLSSGKLHVVVWGQAFGKASINVDLTNHTLHAY